MARCTHKYGKKDSQHRILKLPYSNIAFDGVCVVCGCVVAITI